MGSQADPPGSPSPECPHACPLKGPLPLRYPSSLRGLGWGSGGYGGQEGRWARDQSCRAKGSLGSRPRGLRGSELRSVGPAHGPQASPLSLAGHCLEGKQSQLQGPSLPLHALQCWLLAQRPHPLGTGRWSPCDLSLYHSCIWFPRPPRLKVAPESSPRCPPPPSGALPCPGSGSDRHLPQSLLFLLS